MLGRRNIGLRCERRFAAKLAIRHGPAAACELERNAYSVEFVYLDAATRSAQAAQQTHRLMINLWKKKQKWSIVLMRASPPSHGWLSSLMSFFLMIVPPLGSSDQRCPCFSRHLGPGPRI